MDYIKPLYSHTSLHSWQKANLDYNWYWVLSVFFGWCALDQLYLGSPYGFLAKNIVNVNTFGYWYFYDLIRATWDQESIKFTGPSIPGLGSPGLAAGRFQRPEAPLLPESKAKHKNFFIYTLVLFTMGLFGMDSFLVGDTLSGILRLCFLVSFIFAPLAIIWWAYRVIVYVIYPKTLLEQNWNYFDYPKPDNMPPCSNMFAQLTVWILETIRGILNAIPGINLLTPLLDALIESLRIAYGMAAATVSTAISTATSTAEAGKLLFDASSRMGMPTLDELSKAAAATAGSKSCPQAGGSISSNSTSSAPALALFLSVTVGLIIVSGIVLSLRRSYQKQDAIPGSNGNAKTSGDVKHRGERNDAPPDPDASGDPAPTAA